MSDKSVNMGPSGPDTPPGLSHSLPTSATYSGTPLTRAPSVDSQYSPGYDYDQPPLHDHFDIYGQHHMLSPPYDTNPPFHPYAETPYEVDIKMERQMYVNDIPTRKDSSTSTFSTWHPPQGAPTLTTPFAQEEWVHEGIFENTDMFAGDNEPDFDIFAHEPPTPLGSQTLQIEVDECDRELLDHFIDNVLRLVFPVLEANQPGSAKSQVVLPALAYNKTYRHCCLSIAAIHRKSTQRIENEKLDDDIMRHRYATVAELCEMLNGDTEHHQILEATLGMILFQCSVGRPDDALPDIPWHSHFEAGSSIVRRLQLPHAMESVHGGQPRPPFNMTLTTWIDILGSTMLARNPHFADIYREKNESGMTSGLCELMGCEDNVMYMISEVACLDAIKMSGTIDDMQLCQYIQSLGERINRTEPPPYQLDHAVSSTGHLRPQQLSANMTSIFRLATRIYLCGMAPNASRKDEPMQGLVCRLAGVLELIPSGLDGFDRSLVWPLLIGGSMSTPESKFRGVFADRIRQLGEHAEFGSFGRMVCLLQEVWRQADAAGERRSVHWRDVMQQKGWDYLLI